MGEKHCLLVDRGIYFIDTILLHTDWIIDLLVTEDPNTKSKYLGIDRINTVYSMQDLLASDDIYDMNYETIAHYKGVQPIADAGFRRIYDDYQLSRYDFYTSISFWNHFFDDHNIDICIIVGLLHGLKCDIIVQEIALQRKIPTFVVMHSFFGFRTIFCSASKELLRRTKQFDKLKFNVHDSTHYLGKLQYDRDIVLAGTEDSSKTIGNMIYFKRLVQEKCYSLFGMVGVNLLWRFVNPCAPFALNYVPCSVRQFVAASLERYFIQKYYEAHAVQPNYKQPYVVFYLHLEPEASIQGNADVVDSQLVMIRMLAESIPVGWTVYVANHPDVERLNRAFYEHRVIPYVTFQSKLFYSKLLSMKDVHLLVRCVDRHKLYEKSKAVATVAGTVALEAVESRKPVLLFGAAKTVYRYCSDFFLIDSLRTCKDAMEQIANGFVPAYQDFEEQCQRYLFPQTEEGWKQIAQTITQYVG